MKYVSCIEQHLKIRIIQLHIDRLHGTFEYLPVSYTVVTLGIQNMKHTEQCIWFS